MKNFLLFSALFAVCSLSFTGCVDNDYDLNDIDTDNITVGGELTVPIGKVSINLENLLTSSLGPFNVGIAPRALPTGIDLDPALEFAYTFDDLGSGFDSDLAKAFSKANEGSEDGLQIILTCYNPLPVAFTLRLSFEDSEGRGADFVFNSIEKEQNTGKAVNITSDKLDVLGDASDLVLGLKPLTFYPNYMPDNKTLDLVLHLYTKNGIKL